MRKENINFIRDFSHLTYYITDLSTGNSFIESGRSVEHVREKLKNKSIDANNCNIIRLDMIKGGLESL